MENTDIVIGPPRTPSNHADRDLARQFPPIPTSLWTLPTEKRQLLLHVALLLVLSLQEYSAFSRLLLLNLTSSLNLPRKLFQEEETRIAQGLSQLAVDAANEQAMESSEEHKGQKRPKAGAPGYSSSAYRVGAPLIAVGVGSIHRGYGLRLPCAAGLLGPMADNGLLAGSMFGIYAARPTDKMVEAFGREIQDFGLVPLRGNPPNEYVDAKALPSKDRRLRLVIALNGWVTSKEDVVGPWHFMGDQAEVYVMRWEMNVLYGLGTALETVAKSTAWKTAKKSIMTRHSKCTEPPLIAGN